MGRNLVKLKKNLMTSSLIRKYDVIIVILMSRQLGSGKSSLFLCLGWIKLTFGVRGNFRLLISNLNSSPALFQKLVTMTTMSGLSSIF